MTAQRLFRSLLGICPLLISLLWIAGIAQFREFRLEPLEWAALAAIGFALQLLSRRARLLPKHWRGKSTLPPRYGVRWISPPLVLLLEPWLFRLLQPLQNCQQILRFGSFLLFEK